MGFGGSTPTPPPPPPPPPAPAQAASSAVQESGAQERASLAAASGAGFEGTIEGSPQGSTTPTGQAKQLLGY